MVNYLLRMKRKIKLMSPQNSNFWSQSNQLKSPKLPNDLVQLNYLLGLKSKLNKITLNEVLSITTQGDH